MRPWYWLTEIPFSRELVMLTPVATALSEYGSSLRKRKPLVGRLIHVTGTSREIRASVTRCHVAEEATSGIKSAVATMEMIPMRRTARVYCDAIRPSSGPVFVNVTRGLLLIQA